MEKFNFKPFDKVLIRDSGTNKWIPQLFSYYYGMEEYPYGVISGMQYKHCVPYEGNEHLAGTTDDYVEPFVPQDGDFMAMTRDTDVWLCIFDRFERRNRLIYKFGLTCEGSVIDDKEPYYDTDNCTLRPATDSEKQRLLDALHKEGKDWDEEKKEIVEYKWPRMYNSYAFVTSCGDIRFTIYQNTPDDQVRVKIGNCFHNKEEGQLYADKFKKLLKGGEG